MNVTRAADVWHHDDPEHLTDGVLRREEVRMSWPELGSALDAEPPSDVLEAAQSWDAHARSIDTPCTEVRVEYSILWPRVVIVLASVLVGMALGMALQFATIQWVAS